MKPFLGFVIVWLSLSTRLAGAAETEVRGDAARGEGRKRKRGAASPSRPVPHQSITLPGWVQRGPNNIQGRVTDIAA